MSPVRFTLNKDDKYILCNILKNTKFLYGMPQIQDVYIWLREANRVSKAMIMKPLIELNNLFGKFCSKTNFVIVFKCLKDCIAIIRCHV